MSFEQRALDLFQFQYQHNPVYQSYCMLLHVHPDDVQALCNIPFLPISLFRSHEVRTTTFDAEEVFESSGTSSMIASKHYVKHATAYLQSAVQCFEYFYQRVSHYAFLFLLPSYLERGSSSLVYMAKHFASQSMYPSESGFFLHHLSELKIRIQANEQKAIPTILLGVTYALIDFATLYELDLKHTLVIETGGMKGRRKELIRKEVHDLLQQRWNLTHVHSEYGMTELLSQAYALRDGLFHTHPDQMRVLIRPLDNPLETKLHGKGALNIIDLSNVHSCAFIATEDVGEVFSEGAFRVDGRMDNAMIRGCNQLWE